MPQASYKHFVSKLKVFLIIVIPSLEAYPLQTKNEKFTIGAGREFSRNILNVPLVSSSSQDINTLTDFHFSQDGRNELLKYFLRKGRPLRKAGGQDTGKRSGNMAVLEMTPHGRGIDSRPSKTFGGHMSTKRSPGAQLLLRFIREFMPLMTRKEEKDWENSLHRFSFLDKLNAGGTHAEPVLTGISLDKRGAGMYKGP